MIFKEIYIDGFGIFNGFSLTNLRNGVNIILGNNEVGKSTLLKFLRYTLFGYPRFKDQRMFPLNGGNHGGRIKAILSSDKEATFERTGDDQINLLYEGKEFKNPSQWSQLLGNADRSLYYNVYAFSLDELVNLESLSTSGVEDKIFSVGLGLGNISIGEVESNILGQLNDIYTSKGRTQKIPLLLKEIDSQKKKIQGIQDNLPKYQELTQEIKQLENDSNTIENQLKKHHTEKDKLDNYLKCYVSFVSIVTIDKKLDSLPEPKEYSEDGIERLNELEREEQGLNDKKQELQKGSEDEMGIEELKENIDSISFNTELLTNEYNVECLRKNLNLYKNNVDDKKEDNWKIEKLNKSIKQGLSNISGKWTEQNVTEFSDLISHESKIKEFKKKFDNLKTKKREHEADRKALQAKESSINSKNISIVASLIFLIGSIPFFFYSLYIAGIALLLIAIILFFGRKYFQKENPLENVLKQLLDLSNEEEIIKNGYEDYLEDNLILEKTLTIESVQEIFRTIDQINKEIKDRDELKRKQNEQRIPFIRQFEEEVKTLQGILSIKDEDNTEIIVSQIITEFDNAKKQSKEKEDFKNNLIRKQKELKRIELKIEKNQQQFGQMLKSIDAKDRDEFRKKYSDNDNVKELAVNRENAIQNIETVVGLNKTDKVIDFLKKNEKTGIENKITFLSNEISEKNSELDTKKEDIVRKQTEREHIEGESDLAEVMTELNTQRQKLQNAYKDWIAGKIALKFLKDVKEKYEKEKQPEVIKNSSIYFGKITNDRYKRISVSLDEKDVAVFDSREASKKIGQLSRGTKEQLLISLRLGFIEEYETKAEPLPVIVDEALVNFDPDRAKRIAKILHEFGKNRQILIFTCNPTTTKYFDNSAINIIKLK